MGERQSTCESGQESDRGDVSICENSRWIERAGGVRESEYE